MTDHHVREPRSVGRRRGQLGRAWTHGLVDRRDQLGLMERARIQPPRAPKRRRARRDRTRMRDGLLVGVARAARCSGGRARQLEPAARDGAGVPGGVRPAVPSARRRRARRSATKASTSPSPSMAPRSARSVPLDPGGGAAAPAKWPAHLPRRPPAAPALLPDGRRLARRLPAPPRLLRDAPERVERQGRRSTASSSASHGG